MTEGAAPAAEPAIPATVPKPRTLGRWLGATVVGVAVSIGTALAISGLGLLPSGYASTLAGWVIGSIVAGRLIGASKVSHWVACFVVVFLGLLLLGTVVLAVLLATNR